MAKQKRYANRTVQYWRLVDGAGAALEEEEWDGLLRKLEAKSTEKPVDGVPISGRAYRVDVTDHWRSAISTRDIQDAAEPADPAVTFGLVLATQKDFVPNQQQGTSGDQRALQLAGTDWFPVDNLFVWFLPFGNMIGLLAESTSSSRAATLAQWLTKVYIDLTGDSEFSWRAEPVIDPDRVEVLSRASGLTSFNVAGTVGTLVREASAAKRLFAGRDHEAKGIRIEIKASVVRGRGDHNDEASLLRWFEDVFGDVDSGTTKAQAVVADDGITSRTEVDLLQQRLTRKTRVPIDLGATRSFTAMSAVGAIIDAFVKDREELLKVRDLEG